MRGPIDCSTRAESITIVSGSGSIGTGLAPACVIAKPRRDRRVGRDEDLIAATDADRLERQLQRLESVGNPHRCCLAAVLRELALEQLDLWAPEVPAGADDARERCLELAGQLRVYFPEVEERDLGHRRAISSRNSS